MSSTVAAALAVSTVALGIACIVLYRNLSVSRRYVDTLLAAQQGARIDDNGVDEAVEAARTEEAAAARDRVRLAGALDAHGDGVIVTDADGEVVLCNEAGTPYLGARHAEAVAEEAIQELLDRARYGEPGERELKLYGPPERILALSAHPIRDRGEIVGAAAVVRDVTEAYRIETIRRDFVAAVSHELKTPIGALSLLAETMNTADDPLVAAQLADRIGREAERLGRLIDDLLDLSIVEAQERPRRDAVPVDILIEDAYEQVRAGAEEAKVPVEIHAIIHPVELVCDRRQVTSAIRNLLENAVKYSEPGARVEISARVEHDSVTIVVKDHGIGIPRRDLERIFERFYRVDRARSRSSGGTGLGLAIVRHVAAAHGGTVTVDSVEGEGSVFSLHLPCESLPSRLYEAS